MSSSRYNYNTMNTNHAYTPRNTKKRCIRETSDCLYYPSPHQNSPCNENTRNTRQRREDTSLRDACYKPNSTLDYQCLFNESFTYSKPDLFVCTDSSQSLFQDDFRDSESHDSRMIMRLPMIEREVSSQSTIRSTNNNNENSKFPSILPASYFSPLNVEDEEPCSRDEYNFRNQSSGMFRS